MGYLLGLMEYPVGAPGESSLEMARALESNHTARRAAQLMLKMDPQALTEMALFAEFLAARRS